MSGLLERENKPRNWGFLALQIGVILLSIVVGYLLHWMIDRESGDLSLLHEARDVVLKNAIIELPDDPQLEYGMIQGMLGSVNDPYTYFVEPAGTEVQSDELAGSFGGIGARIEQDLESNWRIYPLPDSPALEAGIQDGDRLLAVDEVSITNEIDETTIASLLRGRVGDQVEIIVDRNGERLVFEIERQMFTIPSVTYHILPDAPQIGLIQVIRIAETTTSEIKNAHQDLDQKGAQAIILDLRDNTGGLVETGIDIAELFLSEGEIIHRQFKDKEVEILKIKKPGPITDSPMVILVNGYTASAAEIIAGALSANERALLIGNPTYGKTTIQFIFTLQDGSSIHVTSGRWWIPGINFPLIPDLETHDTSESVILKLAVDALTKP